MSFYFFFRATNKKLAMEARWRGAFASIAQLAEHLPRKQKVTSSILVGGLANKGRWSRGMILPSGGRGRGFDSGCALSFWLFIFSFPPFLLFQVACPLGFGSPLRGIGLVV